MMSDFAKEFDLPYYFEVGRMGVEHALLPEQGLVLPGDVVIGADSHTCTYGALGAFATGVGSTDLAAAMITGRIWFKAPHSMKFIFSGKLRPWVGGKDLILYAIGRIGVDGARYRAMEFAGEVIDSLPMADRLSMCNMAIEAGAKVGIITPDSITENYVSARAKRPYKFYRSDPGAAYEAVYEWDISNLEPVVALPHSPQNVKQVTEIPRTPIDQVVIGSCTNGRLEDLRLAARVMKGRKVARGVRCIVIPATQRVYLEAMKEGLLANLYRGRSGRKHPDLRSLPWRAHGNSRAGRIGCGDHEPQLRRPNGACGKQGLSRQSCSCRRFRHSRAYRAS